MNIMDEKTKQKLALMLAETDENSILPVWVRAPRAGEQEHYTGMSRGKLYQAEKGGYVMLGKTFKGLTDEMLIWQTQELLKSEIARDTYTVFVEPKIVAEIAFHEFQVSPRYASGLALRFARVKRYRTDKTVDQADTFATVRRIAGISAEV